MAYEIIGKVYKVGTTEEIQTKSGNTLTKRSLILEQKRFDPNTGQEFSPNYPTFEFTNQLSAELDKFHKDDMVRIKFDVSGALYIDKQTQEEKSISRLRAFQISAYQTAQPTQQIVYARQQDYQQPVVYANPPKAQQPQKPAGSGDLPF